MAKTIGMRVGAVRDATEATVNLYGYGVYDGQFHPPASMFGPWDKIRAEWIEGGLTPEKADETIASILNPRITLDDGRGVVWGYQCWWGDEEAVKASIGGRTVVLVDPPGGEHGG